LQAPPSRPVYAVALGKAARLMAQTLDEILGPRLTGGVVSLPESEARLITPSEGLDGRWRVFGGGHPAPNEASLQAAQAAFALLRRADEEQATVIFLVSGGGSAMMEWPRDSRLTLADLQAANRLLVNCGATIAEINSVRRALSAVKGGGLSRLAPNAKKITLIISDTNPGDEACVASGPTLSAPAGAPEAHEILSKYSLNGQLPPAVLEALQPAVVKPEADGPDSFVFTLLDQKDMLSVAGGRLRKRGYAIETALDIVEQEVTGGAEMLVRRLLNQIKAPASDNAKVGRIGVLSAGEFACPARGGGLGGRNSETALRIALLLEQHKEWLRSNGWRIAALCCGTDGIDGNSPAAGAIAATETIERGCLLGLNASDYLERSDSYSFFKLLGDDIVTGPTGTNVRDIRILLAARDTRNSKLQGRRAF
jgi:hydroxypyruvate reductase